MEAFRDNARQGEHTMNRIGFGSGFLTIVIGLALALAACDGGGAYDQTARELHGAVPAAAQRSDDRQLPAEEARPSDGYAGARAEPAREAPAVTEARRAVAESGSFDTFSRTPPTAAAAPGGAPALKPEIANVSPSSGPSEGGNEVVITGSGFANAQVLWGNTVAAVKSQSSNAISIIVPSGERPVTIVVTNRDGTYAVRPGAYVYR